MEKGKTDKIHSDLARMLGLYIKERRLKLKINQKKLAKELYFSSQFLGQIEAGHCLVSKKHLIAVISKLNLDFIKIRRIYKLAATLEVEEMFSLSRSGKSSSVLRKIETS